jgi:hypothetical protein
VLAEESLLPLALLRTLWRLAQGLAVAQCAAG